MNKRDTVKEVFSLAIFTIKVIHTLQWLDVALKPGLKGQCIRKLIYMLFLWPVVLLIHVDSLLLVELPSFCKGTEGHLCHSAWPIKIIHLKSNVSFQTS